MAILAGTAGPLQLCNGTNAWARRVCVAMHCLCQRRSLIPRSSHSSAGADPTKLIEDLAKRKKIRTLGVSMGQGQEVIARRHMATAAAEGCWVLLQNAHLGMGYLAEVGAGQDGGAYCCSYCRRCLWLWWGSTSDSPMVCKRCHSHQECGGVPARVACSSRPLSSPPPLSLAQVESLLAKGENLHEGFRLFITAEPHPAFPIGLLQVRRGRLSDAEGWLSAAAAEGRCTVACCGRKHVR